MLSRASRGRFRALCLAAASVALLPAGCSKKRLPPPLPPIPKLQALSFADNSRPVEYRATAGEAIAPTVVADDPMAAPVVAMAPSGSGAQGPATLNGDPNGLTRETLNQSIQGAMGSLASCFTSLSQDPMVAISFEADPAGRPSLVRINGAPPDVERCVRNIVQGIRFPSFQGKGVQVDLPLSFHRVGRPAQQAAAPSAEQQGAAPLFLQP
jgi:hypothetical protein